MKGKRSFNRVLAFAAAPALFFILFAAATPVFADSLSLGGCNSTPGVTVSSGTATTNCIVNYNPSPANVQTGSFTETGNLAMGTSGLTVTVTNTPLETPGGGTNSAFVQVSYVFGGLGVSSGTAQFDLTAVGSFLSVGGNGLMEFEYYGGAWTVNGVSVPGQTAFLGSGGSVMTLNAPISNGTVDLQFTELAIANCPSLGYPLSPCSSTVDFFDPYSITGASAFDSNGNVVSGATFVSESGFNPNAGSPVPTPEPSSLLLLGAGLLSLVGIARPKAFTA